MTLNFLGRDENNAESFQISRIILGIHANRGIKGCLHCIKGAVFVNCPDVLQGAKKGRVSNTFCTSTHLQNASHGNACLRIDPFLSDLSVLVIAETFVDSIFKLPASLLNRRWN